MDVRGQLSVVRCQLSVVLSPGAASRGFEMPLALIHPTKPTDERNDRERETTGPENH